MTAPRFCIEVRFPAGLVEEPQKHEAIFRRILDTTLKSQPEVPPDLPPNGNAFRTFVKNKLGAYNAARAQHDLKPIEIDESDDADGVRYVWINGHLECIRDLRVKTELPGDAEDAGVTLHFVAQWPFTPST